MARPISLANDLGRVVHSTPAVRAGQLLFTSGVLGVSPRTGRLVEKFSDLDDEGKSFATGMLSIDGWIEGIGAQFWQTLKNLEAVLSSGGSSLGEIVLLSFYSRQMHHHHLINSLRSRVFRPAPAPPNTGLQVPRNPAGALMQASALGFLPGDATWARRLIKAGDGSRSMSHYDLGVQVGPLLITGDFVPGSRSLQRAVKSYDDVPSFPRSLRPTGLIRSSYEETVRAQAWFLYENIKDVLAENGARLGDIARLRVYLVDVADAAGFAEVHKAVLGSHAPVVHLSIAEKLGRADFRVAIEVMAVVRGEGKLAPRFLETDAAEQMVDPSSAGVAVGPYLFLGNSIQRSHEGSDVSAGYDLLLNGAPRRSGNLGIDLVTGPVVAEAWWGLQRGRRLLEASGASLGDVVSLTVSLISMHDLPAINEVLKYAFPEKPPAVTIVQVPALPVSGSRVDLEITAYKGRTSC